MIMTLIEMAPVEEKSGTQSPDSDITAEMEAKLNAIIDGPPINNYMKRQIQLAIEHFRRDNPGEMIDSHKRNKIMDEWHEGTYSPGWRKLVQHADFKNHPRFQGDMAKVTLEDLETFLDRKNTDGKLPE